MICDLVVLPDFQGRGIGKALAQALLAKLPHEQGPVLMYVVPGKEAFYEKLGFSLLKSGMARFPYPELKRRQGYI